MLYGAAVSFGPLRSRHRKTTTAKANAPVKAAYWFGQAASKNPRRIDSWGGSSIVARRGKAVATLPRYAPAAPSWSSSIVTMGRRKSIGQRLT